MGPFELFLWTVLLVGIGTVLYVFFKLLAGGFKAFMKNDD